ncbi:Excinuclease ABC, C subunit-like [Rivularia sp. IAM M-261]|nr:Excinuclease ABC, C subunit-like [Rivularia sp. IAM M-261]
MPTNDSELVSQARQILNVIAFTPFEECQPLSRDFVNLPARPGIYAIRHKSLGLLYIGKTKSLRSRFTGGHKAFLWAWLDKYGDEEVRIAVQTISYWENPALLLELEAIILRATEPPYNVQIPSE